MRTYVSLLLTWLNQTAEFVISCSFSHVFTKSDDFGMQQFYNFSNFH